MATKIRTLTLTPPTAVTDGMSVWVTAPHCVARFTPFSAEVMLSTPYSHDTIDSTRRVLDPVWAAWTSDVLAELDLSIPDSLEPAWSKAVRAALEAGSDRTCPTCGRPILDKTTACLVCRPRIVT